jgi:hypothetical protein
MANPELAQVSPLLWLNYKEGLRWRKVLSEKPNKTALGSDRNML